MKHNLVLYAIILSLSGFLIYKNNHLQKSQKVITDQELKLKSEETELKYCNSFLQMYESEISYYYNYSGFKFADNFKVFDFNQKKEKSLKDIGKQFFFAFDNHSCETCVNTELFKIKSEYPELSEKISILTTKRDESATELMRSRMKIPFDIYTFDSEANLGFNLMNIGQPFYFILDEEQRIRHLFIVNTDHPNLNKQYLDYISEGHRKAKEISMN